MTSSTTIELSRYCLVLPEWSPSPLGWRPSLLASQRSVPPSVSQTSRDDEMRRGATKLTASLWGSGLLASLPRSEALHTTEPSLRIGFTTLRLPFSFPSQLSPCESSDVKMYAVHHFLYMKPHDPSAEGGLSLLKGADAAALPFGCPRLRFVLRSTFLLENFVRFQFLHW